MNYQKLGSLENKISKKHKIEPKQNRKNQKNVANEEDIRDFLYMENKSDDYEIESTIKNITQDRITPQINIQQYQGFNC